MKKFVSQFTQLIFVFVLAGCAIPPAASPNADRAITPLRTVAAATELIPDLTATAAAQVIQQALSVQPTARPTETPTPIPTPSPNPTFPPTATTTPDLGATQTVMANTLATAVVATLTARPTPTPNRAATETDKAQALATAVAATLTAAAPTATPLPRIYNFAACLELCTVDHANARRSFPEGVKKIYLEWNYENLPVGARYTRVWTLQDQGEWVRYQCTWPGPPTGMDKITLSEPDGLHSGAWEVTIRVNDVVLLREQIVVEGHWDYWFYAGVFTSCYGKLY